MNRLMVIVSVLLVLAVPAAAQERGMYVQAVAGLDKPFDEVVRAVEDAVAGAGLDILASFESGVEESCGLRAHVIVAQDGAYAAKVLSHGPDAAFALPFRVGVYEDSSGVNVAFVNPASLNRTVLGDGVDDAVAVEAADRLSRAIASGLQQQAVNRQLGQLRTKGHVGGMGGGDFKKKLEVLHAGGDVSDIAAKVRAGIQNNQKGWKLVYALEMEDVVLLGVTNPATEARAFGIAGERRESKDEPCPGLDHAAAFPIEVVVAPVEGEVRVLTLDEMYRMKVYFQDAGNWAFMKNMTMPGAIEDEIVEMSTSDLK